MQQQDDNSWGSWGETALDVALAPARGLYYLGVEVPRQAYQTGQQLRAGAEQGLIDAREAAVAGYREVDRQLERADQATERAAAATERAASAIKWVGGALAAGALAAVGGLAIRRWWG